MNQPLPLKIDYHAESDTLWISNGLPTPDGEDIAESVTAFFDNEGQPNAVMIEHASKLLLHVLTAPELPSHVASPSVVGNARPRSTGKSWNAYKRHFIRTQHLNPKSGRRRRAGIGIHR